MVHITISTPYMVHITILTPYMVHIVPSRREIPLIYIYLWIYFVLFVCFLFFVLFFVFCFLFLFVFIHGTHYNINTIHGTHCTINMITHSTSTFKTIIYVNKNCFLYWKSHIILEYKYHDKEEMEKPYPCIMFKYKEYISCE
jgi:hypothetical protein